MTVANLGSRSEGGDSLPRPTPSPDGLDAPYWSALRASRLLVQVCRSCEHHQFPPEWFCRSCHGSALDWTELAAEGRIFSWARVWHPVHPALAADCPYTLVLVELDKGVRMLGRLLDEPEEGVSIGTTLRGVFQSVDPELTLLHWAV